MKIIIDTATGGDNITAITASTEDASFPKENLQDDFTTNLWKATATTATLTVEVSKGSAVELLNTNATSATVTAGSGESFEDEAGFSPEAGYTYADDQVWVESVYSLPGSAGRLWAEYAPFSGPHVVNISLTAAANVSAGILRAGNVEEFRDPSYGMVEGSRDYSIERELNNGADYYRKRNVVRIFDGLTTVETKENAFKFKHNIFDAIGPKPLAMRLSNTLDDQEFVLFAKRTTPPLIEPISGSLWRINYGLKEVV